MPRRFSIYVPHLFHFSFSFYPIRAFLNISTWDLRLLSSSRLTALIFLSATIRSVICFSGISMGILVVLWLQLGPAVRVVLLVEDVLLLVDLHEPRPDEGV